MRLFELYDTAYKWNGEWVNDTDSEYWFRAGNDPNSPRFEVCIDNVRNNDWWEEREPLDKQTANVLFRDESGMVNISNLHPREAHKIFGTIFQIIQHHIKNNPQISHIEFRASEKEPSRVKLYATLCKKFSNDFRKVSQQGYTVFVVKVR